MRQAKTRHRIALFAVGIVAGNVAGRLGLDWYWWPIFALIGGAVVTASYLLVRWTHAA